MTDAEAETIALDRLVTYFRRDAIPAIIRRPDKMFKGRPMIDLIKAGKIDIVEKTVGDWLADWDGLA